jgi:hypothetical protein
MLYRQDETYLVVSSAIDNPIESGTKKKFVAMSRGCAIASDTIVKCEIPNQTHTEVWFSEMQTLDRINDSPGSTRFFRDWHPVASAPINRILACSKLFCPAEAHSLFHIHDQLEVPRVFHREPYRS